MLSQQSTKSPSAEASGQYSAKPLKFSSLPNLQRQQKPNSNAPSSLCNASQPSQSGTEQPLKHSSALQPTPVRDAVQPSKPALNRANSKVSILTGAAVEARTQPQCSLIHPNRTSSKASSLELPSDSEKQPSPKRPSVDAPESYRLKKKAKHSVITGATGSNPKPISSLSTKSNGLTPESCKVQVVSALRTAAPEITNKVAIEPSESQGRETEESLATKNSINDKPGGSSRGRARGSTSKKTVTFAESAAEIPIKPITAASSSASSSKDDLDDHIGNTNGSSCRRGKRSNVLKRNRSGGTSVGDRPKRSAKDVQVMCDDLLFSLEWTELQTKCSLWRR